MEKINLTEKYKYTTLEVSKSTKKLMRDLRYWLDESYRDMIERLVKNEWEKIRPKRS